MWLEGGRQCYEREDYGGAIDQLSRFLSQVDQGPDVAQALYIRGMSHAQAGLRPAAYADLRRCVTLPTEQDVIWRSYTVLGTLRFEDQQWAEAARDLRAAVTRMPNASPKDTVLYKLGLCYERSGRWSEAQGCYRGITASFPRGSYASAARRRLQLNADHFAIQCGAFRERSNAETLSSNLEREGLLAYVRRELRGRTALYVVLVGRCATYDDALRQLAMVRQFEIAQDAVLWP
jgi:tetratricopeptide (TPR) repeat protein